MTTEPTLTAAEIARAQAEAINGQLVAALSAIEEGITPELREAFKKQGSALIDGIGSGVKLYNERHAIVDALKTCNMRDLSRLSAAFAVTTVTESHAFKLKHLKEVGEGLQWLIENWDDILDNYGIEDCDDWVKEMSDLIGVGAEYTKAWVEELGDHLASSDFDGAIEQIRHLGTIVNSDHIAFDPDVHDVAIGMSDLLDSLASIGLSLLVSATAKWATSKLLDGMDEKLKLLHKELAKVTKASKIIAAGAPPAVVESLLDHGGYVRF